MTKKVMEISDKVNTAIEYYINNKGKISLAKVAGKFEVDRGNLANQLKNKGISIINYHNETKFNQHVFDSIDTEEKAYWLGFLFADGWVTSTGNTMGLDLASKDKSHLDKFVNFLSFTGNRPLTTHRCRFSVQNKYVYNVLIGYGCVPRKSLILQFPKIEIFKTEDYVRHFIRGYFDGDGCISYSDKQHKHMTISVLGTSLFLKSILHYSKFSRKIQSQNNIFSLQLNGKSGLQFLNYLYKDSTVFLQRKLERYKEYCRLYE